MKIELIKNPSGSWFVAIGELYDDGLTFDEALGVVATVMVDENKKPRYLRTEQEHQKATKFGFAMVKDKRHT